LRSLEAELAGAKALAAQSAAALAEAKRAGAASSEVARVSDAALSETKARCAKLESSISQAVARCTELERELASATIAKAKPSDSKEAKTEVAEVRVFAPSSGDCRCADEDRQIREMADAEIEKLKGEMDAEIRKQRDLYEAKRLDTLHKLNELKEKEAENERKLKATRETLVKKGTDGTKAIFEKKLKAAGPKARSAATAMMQVPTSPPPAPVSATAAPAKKAASGVRLKMPPVPGSKRSLKRARFNPRIAAAMGLEPS